MLWKAFGNSTMSQQNVCKWYKDFKEGRERVVDLERSGRPSTTSTDDQHINKVKELVLKNHRLTVQDHTDIIEISEGSVKTILKDHLGLRKVKSRLVPKTLNFLEKVVALMCVKQCFLTIRTSSNASLREMRLEFMLTTLKQPSNQANIVLKARTDRKEHVKVVEKTRS